MKRSIHYFIFIITIPCLVISCKKAPIYHLPSPDIIYSPETIINYVTNIENTISDSYNKVNIVEQSKEKLNQSLLNNEISPTKFQKELDKKKDLIKEELENIRKGRVVEDSWKNVEVKLSPSQTSLKKHVEFLGLQNENNCFYIYTSEGVKNSNELRISEEVDYEIKIEIVAAKYTTKTERIEVKPASTKWVKRAGDRNCLSEDPNDCLVWCLVETPAQFKTVTKQVRIGCDPGYTDTGDGCLKEVKDYSKKRLLIKVFDLSA